MQAHELEHECNKVTPSYKVKAKQRNELPIFVTSRESQGSII